MKKKLLSLFLALLLCLLSLCSCNAPDESDEELLEIFSALIEESKEVNRLIFGEGILPDENGVKIGAYTEASAESLASFGVNSVEDIKEKAKRVYSLATCAWIENTLFASSKDEDLGQVLTYARYYKGVVELADKSKKELFLVYTDYKSTVGEVDYTNFAIKEKSKNLVKFSLTITISHEGKSRSYADTLTIFKEDHGWRLDAPSYATWE